MKCPLHEQRILINHTPLHKNKPLLLYSVTAFSVDLNHYMLFLQCVTGVCVWERERTGLRVKIPHAFGFAPAFSVPRRHLGEAAAVLDLVGQVGCSLMVAGACALLRSSEEHHQLEMFGVWDIV